MATVVKMADLFKRKKTKVRFDDIRSEEKENLLPKSDSPESERYVPPWAPGQPQYDPRLPYGPNVYLARRKKPDAWWFKYIEISVIIGVVIFFIYMYFYIDHLHFHVTHAYAYAGSSHAQHNLAHKYLRGKGVGKDEDKAMYWFRESAKKGHGDAAYNLVAGHMQGYNTDVQEHEIEGLLKQAHEQGNEDAAQALKDMYPHKY